jgi:hypothetical protein
MPVEGSEGVVRGLNAQGNPEIEYKSYDGGREGVGPIGNTRPSGILSRGVPNKNLWKGLVISRSESTMRARGSIR